MDDVIPKLVPLDQAQARVLESVRALPTEAVGIEVAGGRVIAEGIRSPIALPGWDNSAMDGFAVRASDVAAATRTDPVLLPVLGEVAAGRAAELEVQPGTAVRIMTGAPMPAGADAVVPVEDTDAPMGASAVPETVAVRAAIRARENVRYAGSDVRAGASLLEPGRACDAAAIALLAATGHAIVTVHRRPRVVVVSTGDELVPPGRPLGPARIHDSNSYALAAQAVEAGAEVRRMGIAQDSLPALIDLLREAVSWADVVILSGGVSMGAHDHVKAAFAALGELALWRVAIKPGRPFAHARAAAPDGRTVHLFGLPGNPVAVFVTFELFVRPVIRRLAGRPRAFDRPVRTVRLAEPMRGSSGRHTITRVVLAPDPERPDGLVARMSGGQDSYMVASLAAANAMILLPPDTDLPAGAEVTAWELRDRDV